MWLFHWIWLSTITIIIRTPLNMIILRYDYDIHIKPQVLCAWASSLQWLIDGSIDCFIDGLVDWLTDRFWLKAQTCEGCGFRPNQSINRSLDLSINELIHQSFDQSINESINQPINESINQSINQPTNQSIDQQSVNQSIDQCGLKAQANKASDFRQGSTNQSMNWSTNPSINQWVNR